MNSNEFLNKCLLLDLETDGTKLFHIGAIFNGQVFERKGQFNQQRALQELDAFAAEADYILGHNLLGHDIPTLESLNPQLGLLKKPVVDTLFLSPLAFPENPYHRLVKDYKLVRDACNDPVADARLAGSVFCDQWESFLNIANSADDVLKFYRYCFDENKVGGLQCDGLKEVWLFSRICG